MSSAKTHVMWDEAVIKYEQVTKKKLKDLPRPHSADDLIQEVQNTNNQYESFRERWSTLYKVLLALAKPVESVGNIAAGAASAAFPPSSMIFGAVMHLIKAAKGVAAILDTISDLMTSLRNFSVRLKVYERTDLPQELREKLTEILVTMIEILATSTKKVTDRFFRMKAYAKNVLLDGDTEMQDLLKKLDALTRSENLLVGAETYVEAKSTNKEVQALQSSMANLQASASASARGIDDIGVTLEQFRTKLEGNQNIDQFDALKKALHPTATARDRFEQIKRERRLVPDSGDWILAEEIFSDWVACKERPLLWITGTPGSGKSFLTYNIVTCLHGLSSKGSASAPPDASVGFFFFQDNSDVTQSFQQALCDVAYQLAQNDPTYFGYLVGARLSATDVSSVRLAWKVLFEDYWVSGNAPNSAYIVLDGLDEASSRDRNIFLDLIQSVDEVGASSRLWVAMLGRPHIVQEMTLLGLKEPPTVYVNSSKNGADITLYIRSSVARSQVLKRVSKQLQAKIVKTLTAKAGGMFMWVKLMISELNRKAQRSRESEVEKVLNEAPKDLIELISRVLEGFSATLPRDEIDDLNVMIQWVSLARRPLCLGELDAALRLQSEDGVGLVNLEDMLRKTYASLFTLSREDGMTTSELLTLRHPPVFGAHDSLDSQNAMRDPEEDPEFTAELSSNPNTTIVAFSHTSISDYFLKTEHDGAVKPSDATYTVGMNLETARFNVSEACIDVVFDLAYRNRMRGSVSLLEYALRNWFEHLDNIKRQSLDEGARSSIGQKLALMLYDEEHITKWVRNRNHRFFAPHFAGILTSWLKDPVVLAQLNSDMVRWLDNIGKDKPIDVFDRTIRTLAKEWICVDRSEFSTKKNTLAIHCWLARGRGETVKDDPFLTPDEIKAAAQFGGFEENARFHIKVGAGLSNFDHYEEARQRFAKALELDPNMLPAKMGISEALFAQKDYRGTLSTCEAILQDLEGHTEDDPMLVPALTAFHLKRIGDCYSGLEEQVCNYPSDVALDLELKACQYYCRAFESFKQDWGLLKDCVKYWRIWAIYGPPHTTKLKYTNSSEVPAPSRCYEEIVTILHGFDSSMTNGSIHWLWSLTERDKIFAVSIAEAVKHTGEVRWLQETYSTAISKAWKALKSITAALMVLFLADLCDLYADDGERALELWESLVSEQSLITGNLTQVKTIKREALMRFSMSCLHKAVKNESQSDRYVGKLEEAWKRSRKDTAAAPENTVLPSLLAFRLSAWYTKIGRHEDALKTVEIHVRKGITLLGEDDSKTEPLGYAHLSLGLIAVRDDKNTIALLHLFRGFRDEVSVLSSDSQDDEDAGSLQILGESSKKFEVKKTGYCEGPCDRDFSNFDNFFVCRFCTDSLCVHCHAHLLKEGKLRGTRCSRIHEFLEIPPLTTRFKKGEIVVDGEILDFRVWKESMKNKWKV